MNVIIFSKDRAAQLDLFLLSIDICFKDYRSIDIIYKASTNEYRKGYDTLEEQSAEWFDNLYWWNENNFKKDILSIINYNEEFTVFFTDDDIFCNEFSLENKFFKHFTERDDVACFSLRLNTNLTYCYPQSKNIIAPEFDKFNCFRWNGQQGYYNYPMSVNGHIFKTADILPLLKKLEYDSPTWLEYQLSLNPINNPLIMCLDKSVIVNNPCNVVQSVCPNNRNEGLDNKAMNDMFLSGKRLSLDMVKDIEVKSCHQPIELIWE